MFGIFRKKKLSKKDALIFLKAITEILQKKYSFLDGQISDDFILSIKPREAGGDSFYSVVFNTNLKDKFQGNCQLGSFFIENIKIWNQSKNSYESVTLDIHNNILIGFKLISRVLDLKLTDINIDDITERHFDNPDLTELKKILKIQTQSDLEFLYINSTFCMETPEGTFYTIKDFEDGNYLGVDLQGAVYGLIHDPYEVEKLFDNKEVFFEKLESGEFDIEKYYSGKMS